MTNQATVRSTGTSISTNSSTSTLENASIVRTLFDLLMTKIKQLKLNPDSKFSAAFCRHARKNKALVGKEKFCRALYRDATAHLKTSCRDAPYDARWVGESRRDRISSSNYLSTPAKLAHV